MNEKNFDLLKELLDSLVDDCNMESTIQHRNVLEAIDELAKEVNRRNFLKGDSNE